MKQKSEKYLVKNCEKSQFSIEILIKISPDVLKNFQVLFIFRSNAENFASKFLNFPWMIEGLKKNLLIWKLSTNYSLFSPKFAII